MYETPEQYADRVLNYVLKARKPLDLHDPNLQPLSKAKATVDAFDAAVEQHFQKGFNAYVKAQEAKPAPKDAFDAAVKKKLESL